MRTRFQSLLWWNTSEKSQEIWTLTDLGRFQSLLWWNTSEKRVLPTVSIVASVGSFNPCCGGIPLRSEVMDDAQIIFNLEFQSLLWWNTSEKKLGACAQVVYPCFNPCCGGIPLRSQSNHPAGEQNDYTRFQSLLWWNTSEKQKRICQLLDPSGFNPCCGGIPLRSTRVFVSPGAPPCFNPCCGGIPLRSQIVLFGRVHCDSFNPCCGGIPLRSKTRKPFRAICYTVSILVVVEYL